MRGCRYGKAGAVLLLTGVLAACSTTVVGTAERPADKQG